MNQYYVLLTYYLPVNVHNVHNVGVLTLDIVLCVW